MKAFIFPGQGSQFVGMGKELNTNNQQAKEIFQKADEIMGFSISKLMFDGTDEDLKRTDVTQPAVFIHSMAIFYSNLDIVPNMTAGHSLGEFSALVAAKVMSFEDGLSLVKKRAEAMQKACEKEPGTMAAVLGMEDNQVSDILSKIKDAVVVPANYNSPGQLVISGSVAGIDLAIEALTHAGCRRVLKLPVGGAFHSPLMLPAQQELGEAIINTQMHDAICPVFQNVTATATIQADTIRTNLLSQLTGAVKWTQSVENMITFGANDFYEVGPGKVLQGLVKKISKDAQVFSL